VATTRASHTPTQSLTRPFHETGDILETVDEWDATRAGGAVSEVALASPASTSEPATLLDGSGAAERVLATAIAAKVS